MNDKGWILTTILHSPSNQCLLFEATSMNVLLKIWFIRESNYVCRACKSGSWLYKLKQLGMHKYSLYDKYIISQPSMQCLTTGVMSKALVPLTWWPMQLFRFRSIDQLHNCSCCFLFKTMLWYDNEPCLKCQVLGMHIGRTAPQKENAALDL